MNISVAMASYNGEKYIEEQIRSICKQLDSNDELVISDDGSTDSTINIIHELQCEYPMIKMIKGPCKGIFRNFENAILHTSNTLIFLSDQDDVWKENKVEVVKEAFSDNKKVLVLHDADIMINGVGVTRSLLRPYKSGVLNNIVMSSYWGCCMAFKKSLLEPYLPFRVECVAHDQLIGLLSEKICGTVYIPDKLISHRIHNSNKTKPMKLWSKIIFRIHLFLNYITVLHSAKFKSQKEEISC